MKNYLFFFTLFFAKQALAQTDDIVQRIIFLGDAGEIMETATYQPAKEAAKNILPNKTTVLFLGDNIYHAGMALPGDPDTVRTQKILIGQFGPMRERDQNVPIYFVPGNHDWDVMKRNGLKKIRAQDKFLKDQHDPNLKLIPANGCPDPYEIKLGDNLTIIAYDSQWWLHRYEKIDSASNCSCNTKEEVVAKMDSLKKANEGKFILLASHHPFQSYGGHGGYMTFPLGVLRRVLVVPFFRQDVGNLTYKGMIKKIGGVYESSDQVIYVAGHEHGLQLIDKKNRIRKVQIVSGSGAKTTGLRKNKKRSRVEETRPGFVIVDLKANKTLNITFVYQNSEINAPDKKGLIKQNKWVFDSSGKLTAAD